MSEYDDCKRRIEDQLRPVVAIILSKETVRGTPAEITLGAGVTAGLSMIVSMIALYLPEDETERVKLLQSLQYDMHKVTNEAFETLK